MTRRDVLKSIHEPFGDAFYFGPESLSERYTDDPEAREGSGSATKTYKDVLDTFADNEVRTLSRLFALLLATALHALPLVGGVVPDKPCFGAAAVPSLTTYPNPLRNSTYMRLSFHSIEPGFLHTPVALCAF